MNKIKHIFYDFLCSFMPHFWATLFYSFIFGEHPKIELPRRPHLKLEDSLTGWCHVSFETFYDWCVEGSVVDGDGIGYYATDDKRTNIPVLPSSVVKGEWDKSFSYVAWKNT